MRIVVLESNHRRRHAMSDYLMDRFPQYDMEFFESAPIMIQSMKESGLDDLILIALDHDLIIDPDRHQATTDLGDGVDIAAWLSQKSPVCPVIVHTTNQTGGDRMVEMLQAGRWQVERIVPYSDLDWINERWSKLARDLIVHGPQVARSQMVSEVQLSDQSNR